MGACPSLGHRHAAARLLPRRHPDRSRAARNGPLSRHHPRFRAHSALFNPLSVLYGLSLSEPAVIFSFAMASLLVVTAVGLAFDRSSPARQPSHPHPQSPTDPNECSPCSSRSPANWQARPSVYILIGLLGVALSTPPSPPAALWIAWSRTNPYAALEMAAVALPAYATPMVAMSQLGSMFLHGNSVAAAFVLLTLGAGANLGLLAWIFHAYGPETSRRTGSAHSSSRSSAWPTLWITAHASWRRTRWPYPRLRHLLLPLPAGR